MEPGAKSTLGSGVSSSSAISTKANIVERVETWVEHPIFGDMHVEFTYSNYQDFSGLKVPTRISQKQVGMETFVAAINAAQPIHPTSRN